jgi:hypothetical protein
MLDKGYIILSLISLYLDPLKLSSLKESVLIGHVCWIIVWLIPITCLLLIINHLYSPFLLTISANNAILLFFC